MLSCPPIPVISGRSQRCVHFVIIAAKARLWMAMASSHHAIAGDRTPSRVQRIRVQLRSSPAGWPGPQMPRQVTPATRKVAGETVNIALGLHGKPVRHGFTLRGKCNVCRPPAMRVPPIPSQDQAAALEPLHGSGARGALGGCPVRITSSRLPKHAPGRECGLGLRCAIELDPEGDRLDGPEDSLLQRTQDPHAVCFPVQFQMLFHVTL
jgi:hypothetical protein